jgi:hypothetical protein
MSRVSLGKIEKFSLKTLSFHLKPLHVTVLTWLVTVCHMTPKGKLGVAKVQTQLY